MESGSIFEQLGIHWQLLLSQAVNFFILLIILRVFAYKPLLAVIRKRADSKKIAVNFLTLLKKNGELKKAKEILTLAQALLLKKTGNKKVIFLTARNIDVKPLMDSFVKKGDSVQQKINPHIVAGVKIIVDDNKQLDLSLLHKLENIF